MRRILYTSSAPLILRRGRESQQSHWRPRSGVAPLRPEPWGRFNRRREGLEPRDGGLPPRRCFSATIKRLGLIISGYSAGYSTAWLCALASLG